MNTATSEWLLDGYPRPQPQGENTGLCPPFRVLGLGGAGEPASPANPVSASGTSVDIPTLAFALPESDPGLSSLDLGQPCWGWAAATPAWLGTSRWWWLHEAGRDIGFRNQGPSLLGQWVSDLGAEAL